MDLLDTVYRWDEALVPARLDADRWLLLNERDAWLFDNPGVTGVAAAIAQGVSLAELCRDERWAWRLPSVLQALHALAAQGYVRAVGSARRDGALFAAPRSMAAPARQVVGEWTDVVNLSCAVGDDAALGVARHRVPPVLAPALTIVFCDDLLDPRLEAADREQRARGREWLIVKPTGSRRLAVLLRGGGALNGACWHCLTQRCLHNSPVRAWWQAQRGTWPRVPVRCEPAWVSDGLAAAQAWIPHLLGQRVPHLLVFDDADIGRPPVSHAIIPRPGCPNCGAPGLMAERQWRRPILDPHGPIAAVPPAQTLKRLRPYVSDLCGIVSHLSRLDLSSHPAAPAIYRSGFFQMPRVDDAPFNRPLSRICLGKGPTDAQSQASALCEAMERYAACCQGDEASVMAPAEALDAPAFLPRQLQPSAAEIDRTTPIRWAPAWSLTRDARCYLPLGFCYAQAAAEESNRLSWNSNGCAAGNTLEEAILRGFLELVERDAVALWWYNRLPRPEAPLSPGAARIGASLGPAWQRWLLDLTHDFGIAVIAAVAYHRSRGEWAYGFGSGANAAAAGESAMAELLQLVCVNKQMPPLPDGAAAARFLQPSSDAMRCDAARIVERVDHCVTAASTLGLETIMLDYTRPDIPLHTVKVVVPGLSHIWPGWTTPRLRQVPVTLGWLERPLAPDELNPQPLFV